MGDELFDALGASPTFRFDGPVDSAIPDDLALHVVAVVREALANVAKHSGSPTSDVHVAVTAGQIEVVVRDRGTGIGERRADGHGLDNLASRAADVGGGFEIAAREGGGTQLRWHAPLP